jgi:hypothetical protein
MQYFEGMELMNKAGLLKNEGGLKKAGWSVRLGSLEWAKFTYARTEGDDLKLLGSVKRGQQVGALAVTAEGQYFQVVGDHLVALSKNEISKAIAKAGPVREVFEPVQVVKPVTTATVVTVKRRRTFVAPGKN